MFSRLAIFLMLSASLSAETRTWKSADEASSFTGDYISHDSENVTIRRDDGEVFTFSIHKLSSSDQSWLSQHLSNVPTEAEPVPDKPEPVNPEQVKNTVFDTLCFGDSRKEVTSKLKASRNVEALVDDTFMGRFGLNGTFRTKQKIGEFHCELYFDWSADGQLKELTLQSQPQEDEAYEKQLSATWSQLTELLTTLHGNPIQRAAYPKKSDLQNDLFLASHLWRIESGGTAMLGTSMQANKYLIVARFTSERIKPNRTN